VVETIPYQARTRYGDVHGELEIAVFRQTRWRASPSAVFLSRRLPSEPTEIAIFDSEGNPPERFELVGGDGLVSVDTIGDRLSVAATETAVGGVKPRNRRVELRIRCAENEHEEVIVLPVVFID